MSSVMTLSAHPGFATRQPAVVTVLAVTLALITAAPAHGAGCGAELPLDGGCAEHINTVRVSADGGLTLNVKGQVAWHPGSVCRGREVLQFQPVGAAAPPQIALALTAYAAGRAITFQCAEPTGADACRCSSMGIQGAATVPLTGAGREALDAAGYPAALATAADRDVSGGSLRTLPLPDRPPRPGLPGLSAHHALRLPAPPAPIDYPTRSHT